ncbi:hypothetical protein ENH_00007760 [Eimeria necatrix]|uniref:Metallothionein n=1 Tax=Eimeria necatrix TaxID=51315 RepID=U6MVC3_9EIME|nr:hypothetical protein ENH_00007760 [Eimeria necatrix]CDJ65620.1 hypothetical protein ENH_00007760 [Eimeria necatrix]
MPKPEKACRSSTPCVCCTASTGCSCCSRCSRK